jgi:hypothetical protein
MIFKIRTKQELGSNKPPGRDLAKWCIIHFQEGS